MRRLLITVLGLALSGLFVLSTNPAPAGAAIQCWTGERSELHYRNCEITSSMRTGEWEAYITWTYHSRIGGLAGSGNVNVQMDDRDAARCTATRIRFIGHGSTAGVRETQWRTACNGGTKVYNVELNAQNDPFYPYEDGTYLVDFCDGKRPATCINKWSVDAGDSRP